MINKVGWEFPVRNLKELGANVNVLALCLCRAHPDQINKL